MSSVISWSSGGICKNAVGFLSPWLDVLVMEILEAGIGANAARKARLSTRAPPPPWIAVTALCEVVRDGGRHCAVPIIEIGQYSYQL